MNLPDDKTAEEQGLRAAAERQIDNFPQDAPLAPTAEEELLHELQAHQLELELQNVALLQAQIALTESRDRYVDLYDFAPVGYITLGAEGMIEQINLTSATLLGRERKKLLQSSFASLVIAEDQERFAQHFLDVKRGDGRDREEFELQRGDGTAFQAQLDCVLQKAAAGRASIGIALTDITERKQAEEARATLEAQLRESQKLQALGTLAGGIAHDFNNVEVTLQRRDGTVFPALLDCAAQKVGTGGTELRIALTDISERRRLEAELAREREHLEQMVFARTAELSHAKDAAEAANLAKTIFLANTGHELRTPMHGIMGMTDLVLHHLTDPKQIDWLTTSQKQAKQLMSTLDDIIDISRLESEALTLEEKNFSLAQTIDEVISMQAVPAEIKGLQLHREIDASLPALLCGDAMRMRQILVNFTSNAVKFSARGTIAVQVSVLEEDRISVMLKLEVSDQGIGISPAQQARLFQAFIQVDGSTRRKYSGNGVGLAICKRLALLMGGNAGVVSQEGVGSTFWATARCKRAVPGEPCSKTAL